MMEKQLKFVLLLSLKEIALRRLAVILWSDSDMLIKISREFQPGVIFFKEDDKKWRETFEYKVKNKILKLELPDELTKEIIDIVRPIGLEIRKGIESHVVGRRSLRKLCWTSHGTINFKKTAVEFVRWDILDDEQCYKVACLYCLEDYIPVLWRQLPEKTKKYYCSKVNELPHFWPHILKDELFNLNYLLITSDRNPSAFYQYFFEYSAQKGFKAAAEYFYEKLTLEEKEVSLMRTAYAVFNNAFMNFFEKEKRADVFCFLLSLMTPEQQMEIVMKRPINVLLCFLYWPRQHLFSENAALVWTFLPPSSYDDLLQSIADVYGTPRFETSNSYFPKLFLDFFMHSPVDFRKYFITLESESQYVPACCFLSIFFKFEDSEAIKVIFRNVDAADRVRLVFQPEVLKLFFKSLKDRWHMVEVCLREAKLSKEDRNGLKEAFKRNLKISYGGQFDWNQQHFQRLFEFFDEADEGKKPQKRKLEN